MKSPKTIQPTTLDQAYRLLRADVEANERETVSAMPTTGTYVRGYFSWNSNPTIDANDMILLGWCRLTTGSRHVDGTDWVACYVSIVSPAK